MRDVVKTFRCRTKKQRRQRQIPRVSTSSDDGSEDGGTYSHLYRTRKLPGRREREAERSGNGKWSERGGREQRIPVSPRRSCCPNFVRLSSSPTLPPLLLTHLIHKPRKRKEKRIRKAEARAFHMSEGVSAQSREAGSGREAEERLHAICNRNSKDNQKKKENDAAHEKAVKTRRSACIHASHTHAGIHAYIQLVQEREKRRQERSAGKKR